MSERIHLRGVPTSEGLVLGPVQTLEWGVPTVPHQTVPRDQVAEELERFEAARAQAAEAITILQEETARRLGEVEARVFDPQIMLLDDPALVDVTRKYIVENRLGAARALAWRILELKSEWGRARGSVVPELAQDLDDLQIRVLALLLDRPGKDLDATAESPVVVVTRDLTPSMAVSMDPDRVGGLVTEQGARTSHWAILARSLGIPATVGVPGVVKAASNAQRILLDGGHGSVILDPDPRDLERARTRWARKASRPRARLDAPPEPTLTRDGARVTLHANLDLPVEAGDAMAQGAEGVGLFRTEFLVVGRRTMPDEAEQLAAFTAVAEAFRDRPVVIRTFDMGGDKFPAFLASDSEDNPFLGWRAIRVCLDRPEWFKPQIRALLRVAHTHDVRVMIPLVNTVAEVAQVKAAFDEERKALAADGVPHRMPPLGLLIETPGAALTVAALADHCDFLSIGTNDLTQYTLAVDRTSARLASRYTPYHPALLRQIDQIVGEGQRRSMEVGVCGEMANDPLGAFLLIGLGIRALSVAWPGLPELREFISGIDADAAGAAARNALEAGSSAEVVEILTSALRASAEQGLLASGWWPEE